jgi:hypothetical protein
METGKKILFPQGRRSMLLRKFKKRLCGLIQGVSKTKFGTFFHRPNVSRTGVTFRSEYFMSTILL